MSWGTALRTGKDGACLHDWIPAGKEVWTAAEGEPGKVLVWVPVLCRWCREVSHVLIRTEEPDAITLIEPDEDLRVKRSGT